MSETGDDNNQAVVFTDPYAGKVKSMMAHKGKLLGAFREVRKGILDKIEPVNGGYNMDQLLNLIVEELLLMTEDLKSNSLVLESEGMVKDGSIIDLKRADLLKLVSEIVTRRKELFQRSGEVDLNSPVFTLFQNMCFTRMVDSMEELNVEKELMRLVLLKWKEKMSDWGKDLKRQLKELDQ